MIAEPTPPAVLVAGLRRPGPVRRLLTRHPRVADVCWLIVFVLAHTGDLVDKAGRSEGRTVPYDLVLLVVGIVVLLLRRRRPRLLLGVGLVATAVLVPLTGADGLLLVALALHTLAAQRGARPAWRGFGLGAVLVLLVGSLVATGTITLEGALVRGTAAAEPDPSGALVWSALVMLVLAVATLLGTNVGSRRRHVAALVDRAAARDRERDQQARLAVVEERGRIAREMHDVVAHSMAVMVALSDGAAETRDADRARAASRQAAESGRAALAEMRRVLQVLDPEEDEHERAPQPGLGELPRLVGEFRAAGLPVTARWEPGLDLGLGMGLTVYRLVQEALTNSLRHAVGVTLVEVSTVRVDGRLEVLVRDDGRSDSADDAATAAEDVDGGSVGRGLLGMRQRVSSVGGTLGVGPRTGGGWAVRALLPLQDQVHPPTDQVVR